MNNESFEVRDLREKERYIVDDKFLNGYAKFVEIYAVGVYNSLCRHANKSQNCWPSVEKICEELRIGRNSVINSIKRLEFWNIIRKDRRGKKQNNRYYLVSKRGWKSISEVCLKDFSEVCHTNFTSLPHKLHKFATQTSIVRKHIEGNKDTNVSLASKKKKVSLKEKKEEFQQPASPPVFNAKKYINDMLLDENRHIRIIALYLLVRKIYPENKEQMAVTIKRHLRAARDLVSYNNEQIKQTMIFLRNFGLKMRLTKWTLDTVGKYIDDDLEQIKKTIEEKNKDKTQKVWGENIKI